MKKIKDWKISVLLFLIVSICASFCIKSDSFSWGDDPAAYLTEGFAIADGRLEKQAELNYILHPTKLPETDDGKLVYVWGYPLLLAAVYKIVGYDRTDFSSLIYYKIPSVILLGMTAAVLYLFFRKRFEKNLSFIATLFFSFCYEFICFIDMLTDTEMLFLFLSVSAFYLIDRIFSEDSGKKSRIRCGILLGIIFWAACETRLNGITLAAAFFIGQIFQKAGKKQRNYKVKSLWVSLLPYGVFLVLMLAARMFLPDATSFTSDFLSFDLKTTAYHLVYYAGKICVWLGMNLLRIGENSIPQAVFLLLGVPVAALALWGVISDWGKKNLHLSVLFFGTIIGSAFLPYLQKLRYLYGILPILFMYVMYGCRNAAVFLQRRRSVKIQCTAALTVLLSLYAFVPAVCYAVKDSENIGPFSSDAVEVWHYIQEKTDEDDVIFFEKPRMLYLNTGRVSMCRINGHTPDDAGYYLVSEELSDSLSLPEQYEDSFSEIMKNDSFALYKKKDA